MKLTWIFVVLFVSATAKPREGYKKSYLYFKVTCETSNKTCVNKFCFIKNSRNDSTLSAGCDIIKPIYQIYYQATVSYRLFQAQYRQVFKTPQVEGCALLNLTKFLSFDDVEQSKLPAIGVFNSSMVRKILKLVKNYHDKVNSNSTLRPCPLRSADFKNYNISAYVKQDFETIMPDGDYRYEHLYWNDEDDLILKKTVYERFKTMEDSFF